MRPSSRRLGFRVLGFGVAIMLYLFFGSSPAKAVDHDSASLRS